MTTKDDPDRFSMYSWRSTRLYVCLLLTAAFTVTVAMRIDLSMAIVCMVNSSLSIEEVEPNHTSLISSTADDQCPLSSSDDIASAGYNGTLNWTNSMQSVLFSATFYSGIVVMAIAGYMADTYGPKMILLGATLDYVIVSFLTPLIAPWSYKVFFASRVIMGIGEGFILPSLGSVAGRWFTPYEKSTVAAMYTLGNQIASIFTSLIAARLCESTLGWESIFYLMGSLGAAWCIVWLIVFSNSPAKNRWMCEKEKEYIKQHVPRRHHTQRFPWRHMVTCVPLYAAVLCHFACTFQQVIVTSFLPTFLKEELRVPLQTNGIYVAITFTPQMIAKPLFGTIADYLKRNKYLTHTQSAVMFQGLGSIGTSIALIALATIPTCHSSWLAAPIMAFWGLSFSCLVCGFMTSVLSIAPTHSGTMASVSTMFANVGNALGPLMVTALNKWEVPSTWLVAFIICSTINLTTALIFGRFGSAEVQSWAKSNIDVQLKPPPELKVNGTNISEEK